MTEQHDQDEEVMRAKLFASMKKKTPISLESKKNSVPVDVKSNTADSIVIKSFDQIMREKKANDNNNGSNDEQTTKEKLLNRKRAVDLKNRQRELALSRKQAKVAASAQPAAEEANTVAATRAKRAGQPLGSRARLDRTLGDPSQSKPLVSAHSVSSVVKSPAAQPTPSPKNLQNEEPVIISSIQASTTSPEANKASIAPKRPYEQQLEALKREIELANRMIDDFAQMDIPEFHDLNHDLVKDDDQKFIESMSSFLAGAVS